MHIIQHVIMQSTDPDETLTFNELANAHYVFRYNQVSWGCITSRRLAVKHACTPKAMDGSARDGKGKIVREKTRKKLGYKLCRICSKKLCKKRSKELGKEVFQNTKCSKELGKKVCKRSRKELYQQVLLKGNNELVKRVCQ